MSSSHQTDTTKFTNRLQHETSPYLLQHMHNPVDWYPWGEEAFAKARQENKPIFLSIGYSSCHWCHVMEHESFADESTAALMNKYFVNIKVDREERPDVDRVYMSFVQATTGGGGWPLSAFLTPDLKPFFGGTYFPRESHFFSRSPSFSQLLKQIHALWENPNKREQLIAQSEQVMDALNQSSIEGSSESISKDKIEAVQELLEEKISVATTKRAALALLSKFDKKLGGYGRAPKFPMPSNFEFVYRAMHRLKNDNADLTQQLQHSAIFTLHCMCRGGIYDQIGGGFHRYSVDAYWHVPHFEKMLYDQGQLLMSLVSAFQISKDPIFNQVIRETIEYLERDMLYIDPEHAERCALYSAEDADSLPEEHASHKKEGAFYVWTRDELSSLLQNNPTIQQSLGNEVNVVEFICDLFDVRENGNVADDQDPHGELAHQNVLIMRKPMKEVAEKYKLSETRAWQIWRELVRPILFTVRSRRPRPHLDDKIITSWNALAISGIARASMMEQSPQREHYLSLANSIASFLEQNMYNKQTKIVMRSYRKGKCVIEGYLDDYSFLIQALLDLYDANQGDEKGMHWLRWALELQQRQNELFADAENGAYFEVTGKDPSVLLRMKEEQDGAEPSGISVSLLNLTRLQKVHIISEATASEYIQFAMLTLFSTKRMIQDYPAAVPYLLCGYDQLANEVKTPKKQLVIVYNSALQKQKDNIMQELHKDFIPIGNVHFIFVNVDQRDENVMKQAPYLQEMNVKDNKPTFYLCFNYTCQLPTTHLQEVISKL